MILPVLIQIFVAETYAEQDALACFALPHSYRMTFAGTGEKASVEVIEITIIR